MKCVELQAEYVEQYMCFMVLDHSLLGWAENLSAILVLSKKELGKMKEENKVIEQKKAGDKKEKKRKDERKNIWIQKVHRWK